MIVKSAFGIRNLAEIPAAVIDIELIFGTIFPFRGSVLPVYNSVVLIIRRHQLVAVVGFLGGIFPAQLFKAEKIFGRAGLVIGDVEIQVRIAIDISQGHRSAAITFAKGTVGFSLEGTGTVIQIDDIFFAHRSNDQIKIGISVDISQGRTGRIVPCVSHTG